MACNGSQVNLNQLFMNRDDFGRNRDLDDKERHMHFNEELRGITPGGKLCTMTSLI